MGRTDFDIVDGFTLDTFSPKARNVVINQNLNPLPGNFVSGTTGEPYIAVSNYSYVIKTSDAANDLIAKIEIPYDPQVVVAMGVPEANLVVGTLAPDGKSWIVNEKNANVHRIENNTRIIKMTSIDGEYRLIGKQMQDAGGIFVQYGQGDTRTVNVTGGPGRQETEFIDGMRFAIEANRPFKMNVEITPGVNPADLPPNTRSLNSFAWTLNTSDPSVGVLVDMLVPCE